METDSKEDVVIKKAKKPVKVKKQRKRKPKTMSDYLHVRGLSPSPRHKLRGTRFGVRSG